MGEVLEPQVSIRLPGPGDDAFVARLAAVAFADFDPDAGPHTRALTRKPGVRLRVAVRGGERVGFVVVELAASGAWIQAIAVVPEARGRGVGGRLMGAAERLARGAGAARLRLTTAQANVEALALFLKHGFLIERRLPRHYARGQDACVLARSL
jgi:ribosomal protein S18 acetylase RimI-like enzyme